MITVKDQEDLPLSQTRDQKGMAVNPITDFNLQGGA